VKKENIFIFSRPFFHNLKEVKYVKSRN